ncbi:MAG: hypothetical protein Q8Q46_02180, partial [Candidatus Giovannonibacteria bacterium]|nr:hypothetical protein [Candidatus Giovannonibacteria bacterium]
MQIFKEHHHTLLVTLFLIGALFVAGSFEARLPDTVIAASTPGQQVATLSASWGQEWVGQVVRYDLDRFLSVNFIGETRTADGNLTTTATVLKPGDTISFKLTENASYFVTGGMFGSPPAPWVANYNSSLRDQILKEKCGSLSGIHFYEWFADGDLQAATCALIAVQVPMVSADTSGLNCAPLQSAEIEEGVRELSTTCTVTTSGPAATLSVPIKWEGQDQEGDKYSFWAFNLLGDIVSLASGFPMGTYTVGLINEDDQPYQQPLYLKLTLPTAQLNWTFDVAPEVVPAPTLTFTGNPTTITAGQSSSLQWTSQNTTSCNASANPPSAQWSGPRDPNNGSSDAIDHQDVTPSSTTIYTLTCTGPGGSVSKDVTITVNPVCPVGQTKPFNS